LAQIGRKFYILNAFNLIEVVRRVKICSDSVKIDFMDKKGYRSFPKDTQIFYESWTLDRGSYLFWVNFANTWGKLATEEDPIANVT